MASEIMEHLYLSTPDIEEGHNQAQYMEAIRIQMTKLLEGGTFLKGTDSLVGDSEMLTFSCASSLVNDRVVSGISAI
jgi:hypothetical protein